jgi:hypothetical protein
MANTAVSTRPRISGSIDNSRRLFADVRKIWIDGGTYPPAAAI